MVPRIDILLVLTGKCVDEPKFMKHVFVIKELLYSVENEDGHNMTSLRTTLVGACAYSD